MSKQDVITPVAFAKKFAEIAPRLPKMVQGLLLASNTDPTKNVGLGWAIEKATRENPHGSAVLYKDVRLTYTQFNQWANRMAHYFQSQGLQKGDVVLFYTDGLTEAAHGIGLGQFFFAARPFHSDRWAWQASSIRGMRCLAAMGSRASRSQALPPR